MSSSGLPAPLPHPLLMGHEIFRHSSYGATHPLRIARVSTVIDLARALGWLPREAFRTSPRAKPAALTAFHTPDYLAALQRAEAEGEVSDAVRRRHGLGTFSCPVFPEVWRRPATAAGGSLWAAEALRGGGVVHNPAGGTHHGMPDYASGFCYINDAALALKSFRRQGLERLAYVDIDAHHPDGVEHAFRDDPSVLMISVHEANRWPRTGALADEGAGNCFNLPVPSGSGDATYAAALDALIGPRVEAHRPEALVVQCGADAVVEDPQSRLGCSNRMHVSVLRALLPLSPRVLVLGGGGYNPWSVGRCWTALWGAVRGEEVPDRLPEEAEAVLRALRWPGHRMDGRPEEPWVTTLLDEARPGEVAREVLEGLKALARRP